MAEHPDSMTSVFQDNAKTIKSMADAAVFEAKAEQYFAGQRELPKGRDFRWNTFRFNTTQDIENYRTNYDRIFPNAPGAGL
jgi:hypothetical protein